MSDIEELQGRINAALTRIGQGIESAGAGGVDPQEVADLKRALEDEKLANEQLEERVKALREKRNTLEEELEAQRDQHGQALSRLDGELQSLRRANQQLRDNNEALRTANAEGVGEAHLINKSMMAELESLRATRKVDQAETGAILAELASVIDAAAAAGDETDAKEEDA